jgi:TonB family protein
MSLTVLFFMLLAGLSAETADLRKPEAIDPGSWVTSEDYPAEALRAHAEGTVAFQLQVDATGRPGDCVVTGSSGNAVLDSVTCAIVKREAKFRPALDDEGKPVRSAFESRVAWQIPDETPQGHSAVTIDFAKGEATPQCRVQSYGIEIDEGQFCAKILNDAVLPALAKDYRQVTFIIAFSSGDGAPYVDNPVWGERLARLASEQTFLEDGQPVGCKMLAAEGIRSDTDLCAGFPKRDHPLTEAETETAKVSRVETSIFGVPRE